MKLSEMRELLATRGIHLTKIPRPEFSARWQSTPAHRRGGGTEKKRISPRNRTGLGPLTELLLENSHEVLAIEKDARLVEFLREQFPSVSEGRVHEPQTLPPQKIRTRRARPSEVNFAPRRCAGVFPPRVARLGRLEARGQSALLCRFNHFCGTGAITQTTGTDGRDIAT